VVYPLDLVTRVEMAWFAVGLGPAFETGPALAEPANGATMVYPWVAFTWPADGDGQSGTSWDFQLANGPFDTSLRYTADDITNSIDRNGVKYYTLKVALPSNSTDHYYWRVRPHALGPWQSCYPVHHFVGTTVPGTIDHVDVTQTLAPDHTV